MNQETKDTAETRVTALLEALTLEEKISLCAGQSFWCTKPVPRLGLKPFKMTDGPRGVAFHSGLRRCTAFPPGIAQAASWDPALLQRYGQAIAEECKSVGAKMILAPAINITRTPLNGRTFEYLSEDPYLNCELSASIVRGVQSRGVAACVKHYAANNQETRRTRVSSEVSERALEEIYLPAFKTSVQEAGAWSVMSAYNRVNGTYACQHGELLTRKLREEYGFPGFVVSDWFAMRNADSGAAALKAGQNLEMPGKGRAFKQQSLFDEYRRGAFSETDLDNSVRGLLTTMALTGHLDDHQDAGNRNTKAHQSLAQELAESSITLLKNKDNLLPLDPARHRRVALLGPHLKRRHCWPLWGGSAGVWPPYEVTPYLGLTRYEQQDIEWVSDPGSADLVLLFVGLTHRFGGDSEGVDRKRLDLPDKHARLIEDTIARNPNTVVILINGSPVVMPWASKVPAILECWYPGMEGGSAIARILFGDVNPSGKLPLTFPRMLEDSPAHQSERSFPGVDDRVYYEEELMVGYRHFDKHDIDPLFPFGHGLSYTSFDYSNLVLGAGELVVSDTLAIEFTLRNAGERAGSEVAQLYIADLEAPPDRPMQALKRFAKIALEPGASQVISWNLPMSETRVFCPNSRSWIDKPGHYEVCVGSSSRDIRLRRRVKLLDSIRHRG